MNTVTYGVFSSHGAWGFVGGQSHDDKKGILSGGLFSFYWAEVAVVTAGKVESFGLLWSS